jgi:hypothetical protein
MMLHLFDDAGRPVHIAPLLLGVALSGEVNEACEKFQVVPKRSKRSASLAASFQALQAD